MGKVTFNIAVSLDGFVAGLHDSPDNGLGDGGDRLFEWYSSGNTEQEIDELFSKLSDGGKILMPLERYPFSDKFAWVSDKYGVSWQLSLARKP